MTPQDLRKLRTEAGLSQQALATLLGVAASTVVRLEAGRLPLDKRWQSHLTYFKDYHDWLAREMLGPMLNKEKDTA